MSKRTSEESRGSDRGSREWESEQAVREEGMSKRHHAVFRLRRH